MVELRTGLVEALKGDSGCSSKGGEVALMEEVNGGIREVNPKTNTTPVPPATNYTPGNTSF